MCPFSENPRTLYFDVDLYTQCQDAEKVVAIEEAKAFKDELINEFKTN
jgi:hypothetical protein